MNMTYPKYCNKNHLCVYQSQRGKGCCSAHNKDMKFVDMGVSIEKLKWFGCRRWPCDQYKIMKKNRAQLKTKRHTKLTYPVTDFIPFLKDRWLKRQNQNPHEEVKVNTQQVLAVSARTGKPLRLHRPSRVASCLPDFIYRTVWLIPESRLAGWVVYPRQNSKRSFWANAKAPTSSFYSTFLFLLFCVF